MFATFKKLFGKKVEIAVDSPTDFQPGAMPPITRQRVDLQPRPAPPMSAGPVPAAVGIPLRSVLASLPDTLRQRVRQMDVGEAEIFVPTPKIISQIGKGSVKLSFGELRQMAPPGTFTPENDRDRMLVDLPLSEILSRMNPGMLARRPAQRQVEVPAEVVGPFGGKTKVSFSTSVMKGPAGQAAPVARTAPEPGPYSQPSPAARPAAPVAPARPVQPVQPAIARTQTQPIPRQPIAPQPAVPAQPIIARVVRSTPPPAAPVAPVRPAAPAPKQEVPPVAFAPNAPIQFKRPVSPIAPTPAPALVPETPILRRTTPITPAKPVKPVYSPIAPEPEAEIESAPEAEVEANVEVEPQVEMEVEEVVDSAPVETPEPFRDQEESLPISSIAPEPIPEPAPIRFNPPAAVEVPTPVPAPVAPPVPMFPGETRFLSVSLMELSQAWPDVLLKEIIQQNLSSTFVGLPFGAVEGAIKRGKIAFPWKAIRSWIKPPMPLTPSPHDTVVLELPLKVITPLFLSELKSGRAQKKVAIDDNIPNLFTGSQPLNDAPEVAPPPPVVSAKPAPMSAPAKQKPTDTNYFRKEAEEEKPEDATVFLRKDGTPATEFLKRYATPNEIVTKAAKLPGVEGALIALPDGLLVASQIPPTMNADTIAAFLPQIFGRVTQCTRELRLGDLNNLNFTVGNVPWKIYRVGAIYFAVFGRAGEPLPTAQLVGIAAELDRKGK